MTPGQQQQIMAYLYGELDKAERLEFERQLADSPALRAELEALQSTRSMMSEWKDETPVAVPKKPRRGIVKQVSYSWFAAGMAASFLLLALLSLLAGAQISYTPGQGMSFVIGSFGNRYVEQQAFRSSLDSVKAQAVSHVPVQHENTGHTIVPVKKGLSADELQQVMKLVNDQNGKNMQALLAALQQNQDKQLELTLRTFAGYLEQQRKADIQAIGYELQKIKRTSDDRFDETDLALNKLFQTVQYPNR